MGSGVGNPLPTHAAATPSRFAQQVVEPLVLTARDGFGHLLPVAPVALEQTLQIEARRIVDRAVEAPEARQVRREVGI